MCPKDMLTSELDRREYRFIDLDNGLQAILVRASDTLPLSRASRTTSDEHVSDIGTPTEGPRLSGQDQPLDSKEVKVDSILVDDLFTEKMAAASLTVRCGSLQDPKDIGGVAHFLEHMLFLGSKKYPKENEYMRFISQQGGTCNAYTSLDVTSYYFEVPQLAFKKALDMFANFFVSPLLRDESLDREVQAVDNEFQLNRQYDGTRVMEVLLRQAGNHPLGKFSWGNLTSLKEEPEKKGINMREVLEDFYNSYYSSDAMTLAVQSQNSLDELESLVRQMFGAIPQRDRAKFDYPPGLPYHDNAEFFKLFKVVPVTRRISLAFRWILPSQRKYYYEKSFRYLRYAISHEARDGLLDSLRARQWALELWASTSEDHEICAVFTIELTLTEKGVDNLGEVTRFVHQYLHMLRRRGPQRWIWNELKQIADNNFRFKNEESAYGYVSTLSEVMQYSSREHVLCADELFFEYNPERIQQLLDLMLPEKCNVVYMHHQFQKHVCSFSRREPWMGTSYEVEDFPKSWVRQWESDPKFQEKLKLPQENVYISTDFRLKHEPESLSRQFPVIIDDTDCSRVWYRKDNKFSRPITIVNLYFATERVVCGIREAAFVGMLIDIFRLLIARETTYAEEAGLCHYLGEGELGLHLSFSGFNDKLPLLIETVFKLLASISCPDDMFKTVKKDRLKYYFNCVIENSTLAEDIWSFMVQPRNRLYHQRHAELKNIRKNEFIEWARQVFGGAFIEAYVHGNVTSAEAKEIVAKVQGSFRHSLPKRKPEPLVHVRIDGQVGIRVLGLNVDAPSSFISNHYIYGPAHFFEECMIALLVMFMEERCFTHLRTEEQLGYDVTCYVRTSYRVIGFSIGISPPADRFTLSEVDRKIENFLDQMAVEVQDITSGDFDTVRQSLIKQKSCVDLSMDEEVSRNWSEIADFRYIFDKLRHEIHFLETLTVSRFRTWALRVIGEKRERRNKISVQVVGHGKVALEECEGGAEIWKERETAHCEQDIKKLPPIRCLKPLKGLPNQRYIMNLSDFCATAKFYHPVTNMDPNARLDF